VLYVVYLRERPVLKSLFCILYRCILYDC